MCFSRIEAPDHLDAALQTPSPETALPAAKPVSYDQCFCCRFGGIFSHDRRSGDVGLYTLSLGMAAL